MRFHRSGEAPRSGMKASSNCSCLPALPTMRETTTVLLPLLKPPYAPLVPRSSANERSLPVPGDPPRRLLMACSRALRLATLNSLSTCSARLINSITAATPCSRLGFIRILPRRLAGSLVFLASLGASRGEEEPRDRDGDGARAYRPSSRLDMTMLVGAYPA